MSVENDERQAEEAAPRRRIGMDEAREGARQALHRSEFILSRCYGLLRNTDAEWEQIRREETNVAAILLGYVAPLAAIPPVCGLIGTFVFGYSAAGQTLRPDFGDAVIGMVLSFVVSVAMVFLLGLLINAVAENFDADRDDVLSQKVAAYSLTPAFLSGVFSIWPPLWWLSLFGIAASVYLLYRGLPDLMKAPEDRAVGYTAAVAVATMVAFVILFSLTSCVTGAA